MVAGALGAADPTARIEVVAIETAGDERPGRGPVAAPEDKSRFVKEIEEALLAGEIDMAVHSAKDVPGTLPDGLAIVGVPERADARDALCGAASLDALGEGATVGTSSLRRRSQLLAARPDLLVEELHGNVDTRLRRLRDGDYAAIVIAAAGLARLELSGGSPIAAEELVPAPGQGCLALEAREGDSPAVALADRLTHRASLIRFTAERALVDALEATCRTPVGAHAVLGEHELTLSAFVGLPDGSVWIRDSLASGAGEPSALGRSVGERLLAAGADELLAAADAWSSGSGN